MQIKRWIFSTSSSGNKSAIKLFFFHKHRLKNSFASNLWVIYLFHISVRLPGCLVWWCSAQPKCCSSDFWPGSACLQPASPAGCGDAAGRRPALRQTDARPEENICAEVTQVEAFTPKNKSNTRDHLEKLDFTFGSSSLRLTWEEKRKIKSPRLKNKNTILSKYNSSYFHLMLLNPRGRVLRTFSRRPLQWQKRTFMSSRQNVGNVLFRCFYHTVVV